MHLLANGIHPAFFLAGGLLWGLLSVAIALGIEWPLLRWWWQRPGVGRAVIVANLASALVGCVPICAGVVWLGPHESVDPWEWRDSAPGRVLLFCGALFILTVLVEAAVYQRFARRAAMPRIAPRRMVAATLAANALSYAPLTAVLTYDARRTGDFDFSPDTSWIAAGDMRVYFVNPSTCRLYSIRLDGSDRRAEARDSLGRFQGQGGDAAYYAVVDGPRLIVYVGADRTWHLTDGRSDERLRTPVTLTRGALTWEDALVGLRHALDEIRSRMKAADNAAGVGDAYFVARPVAPWQTETRSLGQYELQAGGAIPGGAGTGLWLVPRDGGDRLRFRVWSRFLSLVCHSPVVLPDQNTVVFQCGKAICVLDLAARRVGRLVEGERVLMQLPAFSAEIE